MTKIAHIASPILSRKMARPAKGTSHSSALPASTTKRPSSVPAAWRRKMMAIIDRNRTADAANTNRRSGGSLRRVRAERIVDKRFLLWRGSARAGPPTVFIKTDIV